jgi:hypothetical protein
LRLLRRVAKSDRRRKGCVADQQPSLRSVQHGLLVSIHNDAGFEQHGWSLGILQNQELIVSVDASFVVDHVTVLSRNIRRVVIGKLHAALL